MFDETTMKRMNAALSVRHFVWCCALSTSAFGITSNPSTVTFPDTSGVYRIYTFAAADGPNAQLVTNYWDGHTWQWAYLGPYGYGVRVFEPSAITFNSR